MSGICAMTCCAITAWTSSKANFGDLRDSSSNNTGRLNGFLFRDPDDWYVTGQVLSPSDDTGTRFRLVRTYGDPGYGASGADPFGASSTEPVGWVNLNAPINVYLNGIPQAAGSYTIHQQETVPITWDGSDLSTLDPSFADWPTTSLPYASVGNQIIEIPGGEERPSPLILHIIFMSGLATIASILRILPGNCGS